MSRSSALSFSGATLHRRTHPRGRQLLYAHCRQRAADEITFAELRERCEVRGHRVQVAQQNTLPSYANRRHPGAFSLKIMVRIHKWLASAPTLVKSTNLILFCTCIHRLNGRNVTSTDDPLGHWELIAGTVGEKKSR